MPARLDISACLMDSKHLQMRQWVLLARHACSQSLRLEWKTSLRNTASRISSFQVLIHSELPSDNEFTFSGETVIIIIYYTPLFEKETLKEITSDRRACPNENCKIIIIVIRPIIIIIIMHLLSATAGVPKRQSIALCN